MSHYRLAAAALLVALVGASGCDARSVMVHRPGDKQIDAAITKRWAREIRRTAHTGDWLLSRSYYLVADGIQVATGGVVSHAAIYDAEKDTIVEAVESGIREAPLEVFLQKNHYVIVLRPSGTSAADGATAMERARAQVGGQFDGAGMLGMNDPDTFYCSELVWWATDGDARFGAQVVITPSELLDYGEVMYWSGERTDTQLLQIAGDEAKADVARIAASE